MLHFPAYHLNFLLQAQLGFAQFALDGKNIALGGKVFLLLFVESLKSLNDDLGGFLAHDLFQLLPGIEQQHAASNAFFISTKILFAKEDAYGGDISDRALHGCAP